MIDPMDLDRRSAMAHILLLLGAGAVPVDVALAATRSKAKSKRFLTPPEYQLLGAVADTILPVTDTPGAVAAGVPAKLDGMLARWASAETRDKVTGALARIDAAAKAAGPTGFVALSPPERLALLRPFDVAALKSVPPPPNAPKGSPFSPTVFVADNGYLKLKELVIALYYSSEIAMTQELVYEHTPGAWQPSIPTTPTTRPWASAGPF